MLKMRYSKYFHTLMCHYKVYEPQDVYYSKGYNYFRVVVSLTPLPIYKYNVPHDMVAKFFLQLKIHTWVY